MNEEGEFIIEEARSTSFPTSFPSQLPDSFFSHRCEDPTRPDNSESARHDFATLITVLSWLYSRRKYIPFDIVDLNKHETAYKPIATGSTFEVTTTTITHSLPSTTHHDISEEAEVQIVIKQPQGDPDLFDHEGQCVQQQQLKSFLMELLVMDLDDVYDDGNIVRLLGVGWFYNQFTTCPTVQPRLILEHADNTLAGLLSEHTDLTWDFKLRMCLDIANGLDTLHRHDIIHGDLTLSNILVFKSPSEDTGASYYKAKIADFGHSYIEGTRDRPLGGTPDYMAPEIEDRAATDVPKAIDIYALGIILWHLLIESSPAPPRPKPLLIDGLEAQDTDIQDLLRTVRRRHESHTDEMRTFLCQELVRCTIRFLPQKRDLAKAIEVLGKLHRRAQREREQEWEPQSRVPQAPRSTASSNFSIATLPHRLLDNILVDYTSINLASGVFHDQMLQTFSKIAQNTADPRCSRAFWELAVCKMARLGDPDDTKPEDAVPFIIRAAEMGEMVAKGYSKRLLDALDPSSCEGIARSANVEEWLFDAAVHGHEAAYEDWRDLFMRDSDGIDEVMRRRVVHVASPLSFTQDSDHVQSAKSERGKAFVEGNSPSDERATRTAIHWAARYGPPEDLHDTVENLNVSVDLKNEDGDTPLITACEAGNFSSACALLHLGARIDHVNHFNETAMHHLWRFTDIQAASLFHSMSEAPGFSEAFFTEAVLECTRDGRLLRKSGSNPTELDPLPILSGFPIERALGRRRDHLVKTMLQEGPALSPSVGHAANGNLVRRMILWASRLNLTGIRQFLVDFSKDPTQTRPGGESDPGLKKVENSFWTFENSNLDYMCSIAQGWTSSRRSWRTPEHLWRLCIHGRNWRNKLGDSIAAILDNTARPLCCFEKALIHALNLKHYDFLDLFLNTYRSTHASITSTSRHYCIKYTDPQTPSSGFDYLDTPHGTTPIIDRILCRATKDAETNRSTLLQRSVMLGDRRLFSSLVHKSGADILRPWSSYKAGTHGITCPRNPPWSPDQAESSENVVPLFYLNCYSLLAVYSKDVWFAEQFHKLGVSPRHLGSIRERYQRLRSASSRHWTLRFMPTDMFAFEHFTPLYFAIDRGFLHLSRFLLSIGASLGDPVNHHACVLDMLLQPLSIRSQTLEFLFASNGKYRYRDGPECAISTKLLPERLFLQGNGIKVFVMVRSAVSTIQKPRLLDVGRWILSEDVFCELAIWDTLGLLLQAVACDCFSLILYRVGGGIGITDRFGMTPEQLYKAWEELHTPLFGHMEDMLHEDAFLPVIAKIWNTLEAMFPQAEHPTTWKHPSLLCLAMSLPKRFPTRLIWDIPLSYPGEAYKEFNNNMRNWEIDPDDVFRTRVLESAIDHILANTNGKYEPSLYDMLVSNDYDLCPTGSKSSETLFNIGYRHGALYFFEIYVAYAIVLLACLVTPFYFATSSRTFVGSVMFGPSFFATPLARIILRPLPETMWFQVPFMAPFYIFSILSFLLYEQFLGAQLINFIGEVVVVRPKIRFERSHFLLPMLCGKTNYLGYTKADYYYATKRSLTGATALVLTPAFFVSEISMSGLAMVKTRSQGVWTRIFHRRQQNEMPNNDDEEEAEQQRRQHEEEEANRSERITAACRNGLKWTYKRVARPVFMLTVYHPLKWTIQAAQGEANFARQTDENRMRRRMFEGRIQRIRELAESDAEIGDADLALFEL